MPRDRSKTERRIVEAYLFYRRGFTRAGVNEIAARAGITKHTPYSHFRSKDDLLAVALTRHHELDLERLQRIARRLPKDAPGIVDSFFAKVARTLVSAAARPAGGRAGSGRRAHAAPLRRPR